KRLSFVTPTAVLGCLVVLNSATSCFTASPPYTNKGPDANKLWVFTDAQPAAGFLTMDTLPDWSIAKPASSRNGLNPLFVVLIISPSFLKKTVEPPEVVLK